METKSGMIWRIAVVLIGLLALLVAYYWVHKPLDTALALRLGGALLDLLTVAALFAAAGGIGRAILARVDTSPLTRPERLALDTLTGLGIISLAALLLGLVGLFRGVVFWPALALTALMLRRPVLAHLRGWRGLLGGLRFETALSKFLALITALLLALALFRALAPPHAWDAMSYHLVAPARYLAAGRIATHPDNHFMGFPQLVEVLFGVAMSAFGRDTTAALVHFGIGVVGLLALAGITRRHADPTAGWLAAVLFLSAYSAWLLFGWPYVDLALFACGAVSLVAVTRWRETSADSWLVVVGMLAGFALGVKYTAVGLALALGVYIAWHAPRRVIRNSLITGGAALLVFAPWLLKGALLYGNPLYPFLFGGLNWDALRGQTFGTFGGGLLGSPDAWQLAALPVAATIFGVEKGAGFAFTPGVWLLTAPLLLIPGWRWLDAKSRRLALDCLILGVPLLAFWILLAAFSAIGAQTRLMMMALPLFAASGALGLWGMSHWPEKPVQIAFVVRGALVLTLLLGVLDAAQHTAQEAALGYLLGFVERDAFLDTNLQAHASAMRHLTALPAGSQVRFLWEPRSYHCPPAITCQPDILFDHWGHPLKNGQTPEAVFASWRESGVDYLLFWETGYAGQAADPLFGAENALFPAARERWLIPLWTDGVRYTLYGWKDGET